MAILTPKSAWAMKRVSDAHVAPGLSFTDADWRDASGSVTVPQAGDRVCAFVYSRVAPMTLTMSRPWQALRAGAAPEDPAELTLGDTLTETDGLRATGTSVGLSGPCLWLVDPAAFVAGQTRTFTAIRSTGTGGELVVLLIALHGASAEAVASMRAPTYKFDAGLTGLAPTGESGYPFGAAALRVVWGAPSTNAVPQAVSMGSGFAWADNGSGVKASSAGDVIGVRRLTSGVFVAAFGEADDFGSLPFGNPTFDPPVTGGGVLTVVFDPVEPYNFVSAPPSISGTFQGGQTVTADPGKWTGEDPVTFTFEFFKRPGTTGSGTTLGAGSSPDTALIEGQVANQLRVKVVATNADGDTAEAYSAWYGPIITGLITTPSGKPGIGGNANPGYAVFNEVLTLDRDAPGYGWTAPGGVEPILTPEWGRFTDPTTSSYSPIGSASVLVVPSTADRWVRVREKASTGQASAWSDPLKITRPVNEGVDLEVRKPARSTGVLVPGDFKTGLESTFAPVAIENVADGEFDEFSVMFMCCAHPDLSLLVRFWIVQNTSSPFTDIDIAPAAPEALEAFDPLSEPPILGAWSQPTVDDPLEVTIPPDSAVAIIRRWKVLPGVLKAKDRWVWFAEADVAQPE